MTSDVSSANRGQALCILLERRGVDPADALGVARVGGIILLLKLTDHPDINALRDDFWANRERFAHLPAPDEPTFVRHVLAAREHHALIYAAWSNVADALGTDDRDPKVFDLFEDDLSALETERMLSALP